MPKYYLTTAIDYVNSRPHIGTAFEKIAADCIARYKRLRGFDTFFSMGNDEHSLNVEREARARGLDPVDYCDRMAGEFESIWRSLHLSYDRFVRTTEKAHADSVREVFRRVEAKGDIYKGLYRGLYCVSCENFLQEKDLVDGKCPVHMREPEAIEEENFFFRLTRYRDPLLAHIEKHPSFILPEIRRNEIVSVLESGLIDVSVSRSSQGWGIPLPADPSHVVYVWFDALINYLTAVGFPGDPRTYGRYWPADLHVIGKDITRFHCVIWPAMLLAAGIELPKTVYAHGFISVEGKKLSKSLGNVVDPATMVERFGADSVRYYLLREVSFERDGDFSVQQLTGRHNADLANDLGNLLNRTAGMSRKYLGEKFPAPHAGAADGVLHDLAGSVAERYAQAMDRFEFHNALAAVWELVRRANQYIEESAPWKLAKDPALAPRLETVLYNVIETLRVVSVLVSPVMPAKAEELSRAIGIDRPAASFRFDDDVAWRDAPGDGRTLRVERPLFPRIEGEAGAP
ncbi:MAG: methionine--tRNA ligase [Candidatus Latescibacterota bacterium]|nr:MAG: methionine--tRNA ligase [Candidatus Latescibacterota bacterium]